MIHSSGSQNLLPQVFQWEKLVFNWGAGSRLSFFFSKFLVPKHGCLSLTLGQLSHGPALFLKSQDLEGCEPQVPSCLPVPGRENR